MLMAGIPKRRHHRATTDDLVFREHRLQLYCMRDDYARYIWPELRLRRRAEALRPLLILHSLRFIGLAALVPGVVSPDLPPAFADAAAYGDIIAGILASLSLLLLPSAAGIVVAWIFSLWAQPISSTPSTRPITPDYWRGSWGPHSSSDSGSAAVADYHGLAFRILALPERDCAVWEGW